MTGIAFFEEARRLRRERLIAEARRNYESIFPSEPKPDDTAPCEYVAPDWDPA